MTDDNTYPKVKSLINGGFVRLWIHDTSYYMQYEGSHYEIRSSDDKLIAIFCPHQMGNFEAYGHDGKIISSPTKVRE